jgi:hypothetical protein
MSAGRPYRDEIIGTIAGAGIRALGVEPIPELVDTGATAGAGTAATTDVLDRARAVVDDRVDVAIRGWVTQADEHDVKLIMLFKPPNVKGQSSRL